MRLDLPAPGATPLIERPSAQRRRRSWLLTLASAAAILTLLFVTVDRGELLRALGGSHTGWLVLAVVMSLLSNTGQNAEMLRAALAAVGARLGRREALEVVVGSMAIHTLLPTGFGHLARAAWICRVGGVDPDAAVSANLAIPWLKGTWMLALAGAGRLALSGPGDAPAWWLLAAAATVLWGGSSLPGSAGAVLRRVRRMSGFAERLEALRSSLRPRKAVIAAIHAGLVVTTETAIFASCLLAVGADVGGLQLVAGFPLVLIAARLPITTLGLGTREAAVLLLFAGTAPAEHLLAASLLFAAVERLLPAAIGSLFAWRFADRLVERPGRGGDGS